MAADLAVDVEGQRRVGVESQVVGGEEGWLGEDAAGSEQGVTDRGGDEPAAAWPAEGVDEKEPVVGAGVAGDGPPGVAAAVGDVELVGVDRVGVGSGGNDGAERPVGWQAGQRGELVGGPVGYSLELVRDVSATWVDRLTLTRLAEVASPARPRSTSATFPLVITAIAPGMVSGIARMRAKCWWCRAARTGCGQAALSVWRPPGPRPGHGRLHRVALALRLRARTSCPGCPLSIGKRRLGGAAAGKELSHVR